MSLAEAIQRIQKADADLLAAAPVPFPIPIAGLEAVVAGSVLALNRSDWWVPGLRERVGAVLRDVPAERLVDGMAGAKPYHVAPPTSSPSLRALYAVGLAMADRSRCALVHLGTGSTSDGGFYEALNLAALHAAHVIFVVAVHPLDGDAPVHRQLAASASAVAAAFGIPTQQVDGTDAQAVHDAVAAARAGSGPHLIEAALPSAVQETS